MPAWSRVPFTGSGRGSPAAPDENPKTMLPREAPPSMLNIGSRHVAGLGFSTGACFPEKHAPVALGTQTHRNSITNFKRQGYLRREGKRRPARNGTGSLISMHGRTT